MVSAARFEAIKKEDDYLLRELRRFHLGFDNLQCHDLSCLLVSVEELCLMADGEAAFAQLGACLIMEPLRFVHHRGRCICVV